MPARVFNSETRFGSLLIPQGTETVNVHRWRAWATPFMSRKCMEWLRTIRCPKSSNSTPWPIFDQELLQNLQRQFTFTISLFFTRDIRAQAIFLYSVKKSCKIHIFFNQNIVWIWIIFCFTKSAFEFVSKVAVQKKTLLPDQPKISQNGRDEKINVFSIDDGM